jgi:hypothetical protein
MKKILRYLLSLLFFGVPLLSPATALGASMPQVTVDCHAHGEGPLLTCDVTVKDANRRAISDADITLKAHMPSMPMAHSVKPIKAATVDQNGLYRATLQLQMPGIWAVEVDVRGPVRERVISRIDTEVGPTKTTEQMKHKHH